MYRASEFVFRNTHVDAGTDRRPDVGEPEPRPWPPEAVAGEVRLPAA
jgi:hypothetical protein